MLIVSKFHDYYDVGMKTGVDKTVVYNRATVHVQGTFPPILKYSANSWECAVLGFCGKFYPFVYRVIDYKVDKIIWTLEEALRTMPFSKSKYRYWDEYDLSSPIGVTKFFEKQYPELVELFHTHKTPVFGFQPVLGRVYSWMKKEKYKAMVVSPSLKDLQFYKVKGPIEAYQEIAMYISGVIGVPSNPTVEISDKDKAAAKGHDGPYSFRKPPGKRGKNRWR